ncbi:MAG: MFS transporter [Acholeplasmataceae bacterium]|nr:MFS transporter [Acholeplasmataceae bacterium]
MKASTVLVSSMCLSDLSSREKHELFFNETYTRVNIEHDRKVKDMKFLSLFNKPLLKTKIKSAQVNKQEMIIGYFLAPFLALISNAIFGSYLNRYYSDIIGWTDATKFGVFSALLPMLSVILVIAGNVLIGRLIDKTKTPAGKARPYLILAAPLLIITMALLFSNPINSSPTIQMIWIAISYNLYYALAYPIYYASHSAMVGLSTRDSSKRGLLSTMSNASAVAAVGIGASMIVPFFMMSFLFAESTPGVLDVAQSFANWRILMIALCAITFLAVLAEYFFTRERITEEITHEEHLKAEKISTKQQIKACVSNKYWWIIILYFLLFQMGGLVKNGSMVYYSRWMFDSVTDEASAGQVMALIGLIGGIPTAIGMLLAWPIANKLGKRKAIYLGLIISVIGGAVSFINVNSVLIVSIGIVLKGIGSIPAMYVTLALLSDVLDHMEAKNKFRSDGFTMAIYGSIMVGLLGLGNGLINALLSATGYDPLATTQSAGVQMVLVICFLGLELVLYAVIVILFQFMNVEKHLKKDQETIKAYQKQKVLASGGEWIDPEERLKMEQEAEEEEL